MLYTCLELPRWMVNSAVEHRLLLQMEVKNDSLLMKQACHPVMCLCLLLCLCPFLDNMVDHGINHLLTAVTPSRHRVKEIDTVCAHLPTTVSLSLQGCNTRMAHILDHCKVTYDVDPLPVITTIEAWLAQCSDREEYLFFLCYLYGPTLVNLVSAQPSPSHLPHMA